VSNTYVEDKVVLNIFGGLTHIFSELTNISSALKMNAGQTIA